MNQPSSDELAEVFTELIDASASFASLDMSQQDAWVSGLLSSWRSEIPVAAPSAIDASFLAHCATAPNPMAKPLAQVVERVLTPDPKSLATTGSWTVGAETRGAHSIVIGFVHEDDSEHSILADVDEAGLLVDLQVGPSAEETLPTTEALEEMASDLVVHELPLESAVDSIVQAWATARGRDNAADPSEGVLLNQLLVVCRLRGLDRSIELPEFSIAPPNPVELHPGMSESEVLDANRHAVATLQRALLPLMGQPSPEVAAPDTLARAAMPFAAQPEDLSRSEREALAFLEWADWLGVVLGSVRAGVGAPMSGSTLVTEINRCPEVTTSISKRERPYIEFALDVAVGWWTDHGLIDEGALTEVGHWALPRAAAAAWGANFDERSPDQ